MNLEDQLRQLGKALSDSVPEDHVRQRYEELRAAVSRADPSAAGRRSGGALDEPQFDQAAYELGACYERAGDLKAAVRWYRQAAELDYADAALHLAAVLNDLASQHEDDAQRLELRLEAEYWSTQAQLDGYEEGQAGEREVDTSGTIAYSPEADDLRRRLESLRNSVRHSEIVLAESNREIAQNHRIIDALTVQIRRLTERRNRAFLDAVALADPSKPLPPEIVGGTAPELVSTSTRAGQAPSTRHPTQESPGHRSQHRPSHAGSGNDDPPQIIKGEGPGLATPDPTSRPLRSRVRKTWMVWYTRAAVALDFFFALAGGLIGLIAVTDVPQLSDLIFALTFPFVWVTVLVLHGAYSPRLIGVGSEEFRRVLNAGITSTFATVTTSYLADLHQARGYLILGLPLAVFMTMLERNALRRRLHRLRIQGLAMQRTVIVGHRAAVDQLIQTTRSRPRYGIKIVAVCLPPKLIDKDPVAQIKGVAVLGDFSAVPQVVNETGADTVAVLACPEMDGPNLRRLAWQLEKTDTDLLVAPALLDVAGPRTSIRSVAGFPLLQVEHPEFGGGKQLLKTVFDRTVAFAALTALAPMLAAIAVVIKLTSNGPVLFRQTRVGRDGRLFTMLKFRTMAIDAEKRKDEFLRKVENDGLIFKMKSDPRITTVGGWLRRYSLDELPNLINVLSGDMSLVGPRPPLPAEVAQYGSEVRRRLVVRPGITGLWQISGRSDLAWDESVRLDLRYVENWSFALDLMILWKTIGAVIGGSGAY